MAYIGKLLDPTHVTRPDIIYATVMMAQFAKNPPQENWPGIKRILKYLKGTIDFVLTCGEQRRNWRPELAFSWVRRNNWSQCSRKLSEQRRVACKQSHVAYPESHLLWVTATSSLIKHTLPAATTGLYINNLRNIVSYLDPYDSAIHMAHTVYGW